MKRKRRISGYDAGQKRVNKKGATVDPKEGEEDAGVRAKHISNVGTKMHFGFFPIFVSETFRQYFLCVCFFFNFFKFFSLFSLPPPPKKNTVHLAQASLGQMRQSSQEMSRPSSGNKRTSKGKMNPKSFDTQANGS